MWLLVSSPLAEISIPRTLPKESSISSGYRGLSQLYPYSGYAERLTASATEYIVGLDAKLSYRRMRLLCATYRTGEGFWSSWDCTLGTGGGPAGAAWTMVGKLGCFRALSQRFTKIHDNTGSHSGELRS
jgi:hypothetical protein